MCRNPLRSGTTLTNYPGLETALGGDWLVLPPGKPAYLPPADGTEYAALREELTRWALAAFGVTTAAAKPWPTAKPTQPRHRPVSTGGLL